MGSRDIAVVRAKSDGAAQPGRCMPSKLMPIARTVQPKLCDLALQNDLIGCLL